MTVTEKDYKESNLEYVIISLGELFRHTDSTALLQRSGSRSVLTVTFPERYKDIINAEISDKLAEVIAINYKYDFFMKEVKIAGLNGVENEILMASLIAADLYEDKRYAFDKLKGNDELAIDGTFNFRMQPLKRKWSDVVSYMPSSFVNSQLKDFIGYLLENKKKRIYIDDQKVYDSHYRRLKRCDLLGGDRVNIVREALLSNCGEIEISGKIPEDDERYLKEFYGDKIYFS